MHTRLTEGASSPLDARTEEEEKEGLLAVYDHMSDAKVEVMVRTLVKTKEHQMLFGFDKSV